MLHEYPTSTDHPLLAGMQIRRHRSASLPGIAIDVVDAGFEGDGTGTLLLEKSLVLLPFRGGSRQGVRSVSTLSGSVTMTGSTPPGRISVLPANTQLSGWLGGKASTMSFIAVQFDPSYLFDLTDGSEVCNLGPKLGIEDGDIVAQLHLLRREVEDAGLSSALLLQSSAAILGILLLRNHSSRPMRNRFPVGGLSSSKLRLVQDFMEQNLAEDVPLATLAALADLSPFHFCRAFKKATGKTPHNYRIERRVERAKQLLVESGFPVSSIASACGFASSSHFATTFARMTGRSPTQFRREI